MGKGEGVGGGKLVAYSCCAPLSMLALLHRTHARSASPGRVKDPYYWFVPRGREVGRGEETGLILCRVLHSTYTYICMYLQGQGSYDGLKQVSTPNRLIQV